MTSPANQANALATKIREYAAAQMREEYPWLKTEVLEAVLARASSDIESTILQQADAMDASRQRIGFLSLSAELRNYIYELAFENVEKDDHGRFVVNTSHKPPALLQTSRQVRAEAAPVYYGQNRFVVGDEWMRPKTITNIPDRMVNHWVTGIGEKHAAMIKELVVRVHKFTDCDRYVRRTDTELSIWELRVGSEVCFRRFRRHGVPKERC